MRGHGLTPEKLAKQCAIPLETIHQFFNEAEPVLTSIQRQTIATTLDLSSSALAELPNYRPLTTHPEELTQIITPFGHAGANAFILRHENTATVFDTGTSATPILNDLRQKNITLNTIYITHRHNDHIGGLTTTFPNTPTIFAEDIPHGEVKTLAQGIELTALDTSGHFTPSRAYLIHGLEIPICICGDILFAGSMGKSPTPERFRESLNHARKKIMSLPPNTLLCPGHGPLTTIAHEAKHNPFLATH